MPPDVNGHSSRANPTYATASQASSWQSSSVAASAARIWSRRRKSRTRAVRTWKIQCTSRSTQAISRPPAGRGTISVPTRLRQSMITRNSPAAAAM